MHVDDVRVADPVRAPDRLEQVVAGSDLGRPAAEVFEQRELDASGRHFGVVEADLVASGVDRQRAEREHRLLDRVPVGPNVTRSAQHRMAPSGDLVGADRHRHGVVGSGAEDLDPGTVATGRLDAQQVAVGRRTQLLVERLGVLVVHLGVDDEDVGREGLGEDRDGVGVGRSAHGEAGGTKAGFVRAPETKVVDGEQYSG